MGYLGALFASSFPFLMLVTYIGIWGISVPGPNGAELVRRRDFSSSKKRASSTEFRGVSKRKNCAQLAGNHGK